MGHVNNQEKNSCGQLKQNTSTPSDIRKERFYKSTGYRGREIIFKRKENAQRQTKMRGYKI